MPPSITRTQRKPVLLNYSKQMEEYCQELAVLNNRPTDKLMQPLVSFQVLGNRVNQFFNYSDVTSASTQGEVAISFAVQSFLRELGGINTSESSTSVCTSEPVVRMNRPGEDTDSGASTSPVVEPSRSGVLEPRSRAPR